MHFWKAWDADDDRILRDMKAGGYCNDDIADRLKRTSKGVKARWAVISLSDEDRKKKTNERNRIVRERRRHAVPEDYRSRSNACIPQDVLADRAARQTAPVTLTGLLFGDPPKGFSALDRRTS